MVEAGRYARLAEARESSLALAAKDMAYAIERDGEEWVLRVEESVAEIARAELANFEAEQREQPLAAAAEPVEKSPTLPLFVAGWMLCGFFFAQQMLGPSWTERGVANNAAMLGRGEWWRAFTALTLHGDLGHLMANLGSGLLFAAFLLPQFGTGATWLLIVLAGAVGNAINAWGYRGEPHHSIGASTAVFGALGLLVGSELFARWRLPATRGRWQLVLPVGAGLALLAYLGVGEEHGRVDFMAHWWGFAAGIPLGCAAAAARIRERLPRAVQHAAGWLVVGLIAGAWMLAWRA
jgi:rhomboid protease GluP